MSGMRRAPLLATLLLAFSASRSEREFLLGDLEEEFRSLLRERGPKAAATWYWMQVLRSAGPLVLARASAAAILRSAGAAAVGVASAIVSAVILAQGLSMALGPCEGMSLSVVGLGVSGMALISSIGAGWASRRVARRADVAALAIVGLVVVAPEALYTLEIGVSAPADLIPLALSVAATVAGLALSTRLRTPAPDSLTLGGSA